MKKLATIFLSVVCVLCLAFSFTACANTEKGATQGLKYELNEDNESYKVVGIGSYEGNNLVIPSKYKGKPVTSIGQAAFYDCNKITDLTIPDSVTSIGDKAFEGCLIKKASIPSIAAPYINNETLERVTITSGNEIPYAAFEDCNKLTSVTIGCSVTSIGNSAFFGCLRLTSVTIPNSVTSIGNSAFYGCTDLTSITIPGSVTSIGGFAFYGCTGLTSVSITDLSAWCNMEFSDYKSNPFYYAHNLYLDNKLVTDLVIPNNVTAIGGFTFYGCTCLKSVTIGSNVTSIASSVFNGCTGLTSIIFTDTSDWYEKGKLIDVTNPSKNAERLTLYGDSLKKK